ncbi:MAG: cohesin domain-containing protein, partial [Acidobacteriota bacterium]
LEAVELAAINAQARRIADFANRVSGNGGALFAMGEVESSSKPGAWIWLRELFPGIVVTQIPGSGGINTPIALTTEGTQAFPGLNNTEVGAARPWHNHFSGDLATLKVLGIAPEGNNGPSRQIILGGIGIVVPPPTPTPNRLVRLGCGSANPGGQLQVPVELVSQGDENALGFSLNFDPGVLGNPQVARGSATGTALLNINSGQVGQGRIGIALALPSGQAFSTGARQIAVVTFSVASTTATNTSIDFGDSPIRRQASNANAQTLDAIYQGCTNISLAPAGYEADVTPRPNGKNDGSISITDWVQVGRFAAGLDTPSGSSEFQRADCAPRDQKGDGQISITDWVQAGRYAAGLDQAQTAGGPTSSFGFSVTDESFVVEAAAHARPLRIPSATLQRGQTGEIAIEIEAEGDENAIGLSLEFDPAALSFVSATADSSLENPLLNINSNQAANGRVGLAMALPAGKALKAGKQILALVRFTALTGSNAASTPLTFSDQPIRRQLADANANSISGSYENGVINFGNPVASVSAASFKSEAAAESINAAFGNGLATSVVVANQLPLPTSLTGTTVKVKDSAGIERLAPLFFVAPQQINYLTPAGTVTGVATITVTSGNGAVATGSLNVTTVAPSLFTANSSGQGVPAAVLLRIKANGQQLYEPIARYDAVQNRMVPVAIDFGPDLGSASDQLFLLLFGSGWRHRSSLNTSTVLIANQPVEVIYAGAQGEMSGLDQLNLRLPRSMAGRGLVDLTVTVDGRKANIVQIAF